MRVGEEDVTERLLSVERAREEVGGGGEEQQAVPHIRC